jgi:hypothetical protein
MAFIYNHVMTFAMMHNSQGIVIYKSGKEELLVDSHHSYNLLCSSKTLGSLGMPSSLPLLVPDDANVTL